jgi:hypothetical protein
MTLDEARKVAGVVSQADGGCPYCVSQLVESLGEMFPEFDWEMDPEEFIPTVKVKENGKVV